MKTDRELLELAAKAAGISYVEWSRWHQAYGDCWVEGLDCGGPILWNPLTNDGDALRLAVKLKLVIDTGYNDGVAIGSASLDMVFYYETYSPMHFGADKNAATRRAIVRAAAAIGEGMK